jgi:scyllo-inositol 2-dehydrogenase (NADP+)
MKALRTAIVGLGRIGWQFHAPQVAAHDGFSFVAAVDPLEERRQEAVDRYGVRGYSTYGEMLAQETLDLVVIASPTPYHASQAIAAFERGYDVFCDKPMAPTLAETDRMIEAMRTHGRKLMVYQPHRARADTVALQAILAQGWIGPLYMIKSARTGYTRRNDWQAFRQYGGGMLNNYGAHYVDLLLHLSGSRAKRVCCALRVVATLGDAEDVVKAVIETESGVILDLEINMASAHPMRPWQVLGQRGSAVLDEVAWAWHVRYYREEALGEGVVHAELAAPQRRYDNVDETISWEEQTVPVSEYAAVDYYEQCYRYYALDEAPYVPIEETREVMRVLEMCRGA